MNKENKKLIIFDDGNENYGELRFVKFLDEEKKIAIFYDPLIAPKYFENYLKENEIVKAYEVTSEEVLNNNYDKVYTFTDNHGVYDVNKGIEVENKLVLLVDPGINIEIELPFYLYEIKDGVIYLKKVKKKPKNKGYCYVVNEEYVNPELRKIMIPVTEAIPGVLSINGYDFKCDIKTKTYKLEK